jgi:DNA repair exonuclease SbcCD ATPase subunit
MLSTGNQFTEVDLNRSKSTLIVGENGAGKSTILDALSFVLYGKPFRDINKPQLVNAMTGKNLLVEIDFSIGNKEYMIRRGMKPTVFEVFLNGQMINQSASMTEYQEMLEKNILKMNHKSFNQVVVLGSANYVPFMQLKAWERRPVVEDLLDIQIFSIMNSLLKDKISSNKSDVNENDHRIALLEKEIELQQKLNELTSQQANKNLPGFFGAVAPGEIASVQGQLKKVQDDLNISLQVYNELQLQR